MYRPYLLFHREFRDYEWYFLYQLLWTHLIIIIIKRLFVSLFVSVFWNYYWNSFPSFLSLPEFRGNDSLGEGTIANVGLDNPNCQNVVFQLDRLYLYKFVLKILSSDRSNYYIFIYVSLLLLVFLFQSIYVVPETFFLSFSIIYKPHVWYVVHILYITNKILE